MFNSPSFSLISLPMTELHIYNKNGAHNSKSLQHILIDLENQ